MDNYSESGHGIQLMVERCRDAFRRPENTDFYSPEDYKEAERKFVKFCLNGRAGNR